MFEIYETDVAVGRMSRSHTVTVQRDGVSKPESAPVARADMGILGPGWEAEFVGGQLNRKLEQSGNTAVVTDLTMNAAVTYALKSSLDFPDGGRGQEVRDPRGRHPHRDHPVQRGDGHDGVHRRRERQRGHLGTGRGPVR
ncbi:hypothetical protein [Streptomyces virginiae]|uniref:hypothetical protein n=1 Tax=Streptomyces virginiae TaxID=1961 RepID=UPI001AD7E892|nr:hypothetical protein [Streptomyces virginiae]